MRSSAASRRTSAEASSSCFRASLQSSRPLFPQVDNPVDVLPRAARVYEARHGRDPMPSPWALKAIGDEQG